MAERPKRSSTAFGGATDRRQFLTSLAAVAAGAALAPGAKAHAQAARPGTHSGGVPRIDVHHHYQSPGLTQYLASYWGGQGVRVNAITPSGVFSGQNETFVRNYAQRVPLGRMASRDDIVNGMLFLASDAASYLNGHNLVVDGGWTVW